MGLTFQTQLFFKHPTPFPINCCNRDEKLSSSLSFYFHKTAAQPQFHLRRATPDHHRATTPQLPENPPICSPCPVEATTENNRALSPSSVADDSPKRCDSVVILAGKQEQSVRRRNDRKAANLQQKLQSMGDKKNHLLSPFLFFLTEFGKSDGGAAMVQPDGGGALWVARPRKPHQPPPFHRLFGISDFNTSLLSFQS